MQEEMRDDSEQKTKVSRRQLLKLLAATSTAVALQRLLPQQWTTPSVAASAAEPAALMLFDLQTYWRPYNSAGYFNGSARVRFGDPLGEIQPNSSFYADGSFQGSISNGLPVADIGGDFIPYNATHGTIRFPLPVPLGANTTEKIGVAVESALTPGLLSNTVVNTFAVYDNGVLNISDLEFRTKGAINAGPGCLAAAYFHYNGSLVNMVKPSTNIYAWQNTSGWIGPGGSLNRSGAEIMPSNAHSGEVLVGLPGIYNSSSPFLLRLFLEDDSYPYQSNELLGVFTGCSTPMILDMAYQACGPGVQEGAIGCRITQQIHYYDASGAISGAARLSVAYDGQVLIDDLTLDELGVGVPNPVQGYLFVPLLIPSTGNALMAKTDLLVQLTNADGISSDKASMPLDVSCAPDFPLVLDTTSALLINQTESLWRIDASYNDSAGLLSNSSLLTAVLNKGGALQTVYNALPISAAGGVWPNSTYLTYPAAGANCTVVPVNGSAGDLYFAINANGALTNSMSNAEVQLSWFLTEPPTRDSEVQQISFVTNDDMSYSIFAPLVRRP